MSFDPRPAIQVGLDWNVPVRVGTLTVLAGDVVVADDKAVLVFPPQIAEEVIDRATRTVRQEQIEREMARQSLQTDRAGSTV
jgi:regulator of RNase E activity RraA